MAKDMLLTLEEKVDPGHTALIVVDYQNDFVAQEGVFGRVGFDVQRFRDIEPDLSRFIPKVRGRGIPVIFIKCVYNTEDNRYLSDVFLSQARRTRSGVYHEHPLCVDGTWGSKFYGEVQPLEEDIIVVKHRFNAFIDTDLNLILRSMGIRTLIFTGIATHVCVESTVRHAFFYDYYNVVVRDCVATWDEELHRTALKNMDFLFGQVADAKEVFEALDTYRDAEPSLAGSRTENGGQ